MPSPMEMQPEKSRLISDFKERLTKHWGLPKFIG
jgi:hypothetical protein